MTENDKIKKLHTGELYFPGDRELMREQLRRMELIRKYNKTRFTPLGYLRRAALAKRMFAEIGKGCYIESPFYSSWGGKHVHLGDGVYANFNLTLVDDTHIYIGSQTMFGPNVTVATAAHPIRAELRAGNLEYNKPVHIGSRCWIGAGAVILPGVTIGDNVVIGAGSVVSRDIPSNVVAVGNPCRVMRDIGERDRVFYDRDKQVPEEFLKLLNSPEDGEK